MSRASAPTTLLPQRRPCGLRICKATLRYYTTRNVIPALAHGIWGLFAETGVQIEEFSRASHAAQTQALVKAGYGLALIREGMLLDSE